ncbi:hypothetical protein GUJ93_ZPchr0010g10818 [Zizania palustris]|uniref:Uncharacterized protein n=1 Tax=Zizania palustris TaxID=103762 RepID=A0A8J5W7B2_ZIZPA|nr:hypothetical protein GUJ93_ZPchr0010g10818 [Zizania palustris]
MASLEFSEALPFTVFASLLVEMVVWQDMVIEEVKELDRAANFREFTKHGYLTIDLSSNEKMIKPNVVSLDSHTIFTATK